MKNPLLHLGLAALCHVVFLTAPAAHGANTFTTTGSLITARNGHTATLLPNGKVLVAGGNDFGGVLTSTEIYDPTRGTWSATASLIAARTFHTATVLPNGKVLVAGGFSGATGLTSAELYDPATGTWSGTGPLGTTRYHHTATLLPNGKVLVAGGFGSSGSLTSAEIYDPAGNGGAGSWSATGALAAARFAHTATLLPNGKVLVAGGFGGHDSLTSAELYDPAGNGGTGSWSATGPLGTRRYHHTATLLPNGKVLATGGENSSGILSDYELYNPATGTWALFTGIGTQLRALVTRPRSCRTAKCSSQEASASAAVKSPARCFTIRSPAPGAPRARSPSRALLTPPHCCPMARCSSWGA